MERTLLSGSSARTELIELEGLNLATLPVEPMLFISVMMLLEPLTLRLILGLLAREAAGDAWNGTGGDTTSRAARVTALWEDEGRLWERERGRWEGEMEWPEDERLVMTGFLRRLWKRTKEPRKRPMTPSQ